MKVLVFFCYPCYDCLFVKFNAILLAKETVFTVNIDIFFDIYPHSSLARCDAKIKSLEEDKSEGLVPLNAPLSQSALLTERLA